MLTPWSGGGTSDMLVFLCDNGVMSRQFLVIPAASVTAGLVFVFCRSDKGEINFHLSVGDISFHLSVHPPTLVCDCEG